MVGMLEHFSNTGDIFLHGPHHTAVVKIGNNVIFFVAGGFGSIPKKTRIVTNDCIRKLSLSLPPSN